MAVNLREKIIMERPHTGPQGQTVAVELVFTYAHIGESLITTDYIFATQGESQDVHRK